MELTFKRPAIHYSQNIQSQLRDSYDVVMVDQQTLHAEDPSLRDEFSRHLRVIVGKLSTINLGLRVFTDSYKRSTMIVTTDEEAASNRHIVRYLESQGIAMLALKKNEEGNVDLISLLRTFASLKITSVLVEGSPELAEQLKRLD